MRQDKGFSVSKTGHNGTLQAISATANTKKRNLYKVGDMVDVDPASQEALYTYASPSFKKMISYLKEPICFELGTSETTVPNQTPPEWNAVAGLVQAPEPIASATKDLSDHNPLSGMQAKKSAGPVTVKSSFFDTSGAESPGVDYKNASDTDVVAGIRAYSGNKSITAKERQDVLLFRTKYLGKYWSFGISIAEVQGEKQQAIFHG
ncbi:hypothetical protein HPB51_015455 [Rhipicephalus microplus]|uniref:Uncharacterized protein n=1 Tax=Rhipicephalus microplus TaxID=6941 RepID=A0A9J6E9T4_RHIMP|nr:hypothetical protein HPB51_015455 [Rhipicephalus microplus]